MEMILKLIGSGPRIYFSSTFNVFDGIVVLMSFVDITLTAVTGGSAGGLSALRTMRLARIFKLARSWSDLRKLVATIVFSIGNVSNAVVVLGIIMFIFTLLGMQLVGGQYDALVAAGIMDAKPRTHWDTFWWAFVSTFQVITGENWNSVLGEAYAAIGGTAIVYLFAVNIVGNYVFLNLFLAILLGCFESASENEAKENEEKEAEEEAKRAAADAAAAGAAADSSASAAKPLAITDSSGTAAGATAPGTDAGGDAGKGAPRVAPDTVADSDADAFEVDENGSRVSKGPARAVAAQAHSSSNGAVGGGGSSSSRSSRGFGANGLPPSTPPGTNLSSSPPFAAASSMKRADTGVAAATGITHAVTMADLHDAKTTTDVPTKAATKVGASPGSSVAGGAAAGPAATLLALAQPINASTASNASAAGVSAPTQSPPKGHTPAGAAAAAAAQERLIGGSSATVASTTPGGGGGAGAAHLHPLASSVNNSAAGDPVAPVEAEAKMDMRNGAPAAFEAAIKTTGADGQSKAVAIRVLPSGDVRVVEVNSNDSPENSSMTSHLFSATASFYRLNLKVDPDADGKYARSQVSLGFLTPANPLRRAAAVIITHPWFEKFILLLILISSINLALDEPRVAYCETLDPNDPNNCIALSLWLGWSDIVITSIFVTEMALKIITLGFAFTPSAYLRNSWNILDFLIVIISVLSLSLSDVASQLKALRSLRALRALRPLRVVSRYPGLKLVVNAVLGAIPKVKSVVLINFLFFFILAIVGVQNFSGALDYCNDPSITDFSQCTGFFTVTDDGCLFMPSGAAEDACRANGGALFPRRIQTYYQNYDSIWQALMTVFEVASGENWPGIMYYAVDAVGPGQPSVVEYNTAAALYFIIIQVVCDFFLMELFTGVIIANYDELKEASAGSGLLTPEQQLWVEQMKLMMSSSPAKQMIRPAKGAGWSGWTGYISHVVRRVRNGAYDLATSMAFEWFIMTIILTNTIALAMKYTNQPLSYISGIENANNAFALIFACEAIVKLTAFGPRQYFSTAWNRFDFALVIASALGVAFSLGPIATLLRVFRVARIFRLIRTSKGLQLLFRTLIVSLPSLANVGTILLLIYYIFSIVGMNLFAGVRYGWDGYLSPEANFDSFFTSMLTLFRCSTGENYNGILHNLEVDEPYCSNDVGNCGNNVAPSVFFTLFYTLSSFVMIKLLVAVVLDSFSDTLSADEQKDEFRLTPDILEHYSDVWGRCDPLATKYVDQNMLIKLVSELEYPLGLRNSPGVRHNDSVKKAAAALLGQLAIPPDTAGRYQFHTILQALARNASGGKELVPAKVALSGDVQMSEFTVREQLAAIKIQGVFRAKLARRAVAERRARIAAGELLPEDLDLPDPNVLRTNKGSKGNSLQRSGSLRSPSHFRSLETARAIAAEKAQGNFLRGLVGGAGKATAAAASAAAAEAAAARPGSLALPSSSPTAGAGGHGVLHSVKSFTRRVLHGQTSLPTPGGAAGTDGRGRLVIPPSSSVSSSTAAAAGTGAGAAVAVSGAAGGAEIELAPVRHQHDATSAAAAAGVPDWSSGGPGAAASNAAQVGAAGSGDAAAAPVDPQPGAGGGTGGGSIRRVPTFFASLYDEDDAGHAGATASAAGAADATAAAASVAPAPLAAIG